METAEPCLPGPGSRFVILSTGNPAGEPHVY